MNDPRPDPDLTPADPTNWRTPLMQIDVDAVLLTRCFPCGTGEIVIEIGVPRRVEGLLGAELKTWDYVNLPTLPLSDPRPSWRRLGAQRLHAAVRLSIPWTPLAQQIGEFGLQYTEFVPPGVTQNPEVIAAFALVIASRGAE